MLSVCCQCVVRVLYVCCPRVVRVLYCYNFILGVEMFKETLDKAEAGDNCGALIKGLKRNELRRGQVLCKPGTSSMHNHVKAQIYLLSKEEGGKQQPVTQNFQPQMFCMTWNFPAYIQLTDRDMMMPGEDASVQLVIKNKMVSVIFSSTVVCIHRVCVCLSRL